MLGKYIVQIARKRKRYFGHKSCGVIGNHFGEVGDKIEVGPLVYYALKLTGYRVSKETIL